MQSKNKKQLICRMAALCTVAAIFLAGSVSADTNTWSTTTSGAAVDGTGAWNTSTANWVGAGDVHSVWNNSNVDTAAFGNGGTAGTVTLESGITLGGLIFNAGITGAYTLAGGPFSLVSAPVFSVNADATISAAIQGSEGFTKTGAGTLTLTSLNSSFSGDINVEQGTLAANGKQSVPSKSVLGDLISPREIIVKNSGVLSFMAHDVFGSAGVKPVVSVTVESGGAIKNNNTFTTLGPINLEGGTMTSSGGANPGFQAYSLSSTVTSGGNAAINTTGGTYNGVHVGNNLFAVTGGTLTVSAPLINRFGGATAGFLKSGDGSMVLSANNSFSGNVIVSNGTLQVGSGGAAGTLGTGVSAVNLVNADASLVINRSGSLSHSGSIIGSGSVVKQGTGLLTLSGVNSYAGGTTVSDGVLAVTTTNALPGYATAGKVTLASGTGLSVGVGSWSDTDITSLIDTGVYGSDTTFGFDTTAGNYTYNGQFTLPTVAGLVKTGPNALTISGGNTCTGGVTVLSGIMQADFGTGIPATTNVTLSGASYSSVSGSVTDSLGIGAGEINLVTGTASGFSAVDVPLSVNIGGAGAALSWGTSEFNPSSLVLNELGANTNLTLVNAINLNGANRTVTVNATAAGAVAEISGVIANGSATDGLIKGGAGILELTAGNTYSGGTTINGGTLKLSGGDNRLNTSGFITLNSGTLDLGGNSQTLASKNLIMANGTRLENGTINYRYWEWTPADFASVTFANGGGFNSPHRLILRYSPTLILAADAGALNFGGDGGGVSNFIGVDQNYANVANVNGGSLNFTNMTNGAGYLRMGANGHAASTPTGTLNVNGGAVNVGHSMNMGGRYDNNLSGASFGVATLNLTGGEVNIGTGTSTATANGVNGWLYVGNNSAATVSSSTINLDGGTLTLAQLQAGAYGANTINFNGGILKASQDNATFINGDNLDCNINEGGAVIDTDGFTAGIAADLDGSGSLVKQGAGTLVLSGNNTYIGVTSVDEGTLRLNGVLDSGTSTKLEGDALNGIALHLDASDITSLATNANGSGAVTTTGDPVGYWGDLSDSDLPAKQPILSRRPVYQASVAAFNNMPVIQFDGEDDDITSLLNINATSIPDITIMMVCRQVSYKVGGGLWGHDNGGWDRIQLLNFGAVGLNNIAGFNGSIPVKGMNTNIVFVYTALLKNGVASGSSVYINGVSDSNAGLPAFTSQEGPGQALFTLGNISPGNAYQGHIQIGEVLVYNSALGDTARSNVESYLRDKWLGGVPGVVEVASGAVLDLDGTSQTLASVSGSGVFSNGTLTVNNDISPAGSSIGTLNLSSLSLNGTLLANVATDGSSDLLATAGDTDLDGLTLQVIDTALLDPSKSYTVVTCSGNLTGAFAATNLENSWIVKYDRTPGAGTATIVWQLAGTVILVQ